MSAKHVLVTGGSGKAGKWVVADLLAHGYEVTNVDLKPSDQAATYRADLTDLGQTFGMVEGKDGIIHLAAIPWAGEHPQEVVFRNNVMSTFNILQAASVLGVDKVVMAGSESALGFPFMVQPFSPLYLPMDEAHPLLAQDAYGLGKIVIEGLAQGYCRRRPSMSILSMRFSYIIVPEEYGELLPQAWADPTYNAFNLWAYVDARDAAESCRLALEYAQPGFDAFYIAAPDTVMREPTLDLVQRYYPGVERVADDFGGRQSPLDVRHAEEVLGFKARYIWPDFMGPDGALKAEG